MSELYHTSQRLTRVRLEYFPTSISVCIWNKLYAGFYLRDVMSMPLLEFLNEVWFIKLLGGGATFVLHF